MSSGSASLIRCPDEILLDIFKQLPRSDLRSLCLVHSRCRVAEVQLYADIEWRWAPANLAFVPLLLRTLLQRPEKGSLVRHLRLLGWNQFGMWFRKLPPRTFNGDWEAVDQETLDLATAAVASIETLSEEERGSWSSGLREGIPDAWVALLLSRLPGLRSLRLEQNCCKETTFLGMLLRHALTGDRNDSSNNNNNNKPGSLPRWRHLKKVVLLCSSGQDNPALIRNNDTLLTFFYLPALEDLTAAMEYDGRPLSWPSTPPNPTALTSLHLSTATTSSLCAILATLPNLRSLRWDWFWNPTWNAPQDGHDDFHSLAPTTTPGKINLEQLTAGLLATRHTLETLVIALDCPSYDLSEDWPEARYLGSLRDLAKLDRLTTLQAPISLLAVNWSSAPVSLLDGNASAIERLQPLSSILPRSLRRLWVAEDPWHQGRTLSFELDRPEPVQDWVLARWFSAEGAWREAVPALERVALVVTDDEGGFRGRSQNRKFEDPLGDAVAICEGAGLKYDYTWKEGSDEDEEQHRERSKGYDFREWVNTITFH